MMMSKCDDCGYTTGQCKCYGECYDDSAEFRIEEMQGTIARLEKENAVLTKKIDEVIEVLQKMQ